MAYVPPSDWELKDFIRDHAEAVYRSCGFLTLGRRDAGEMTREIFLKVLNQGMEFRSAQDARAWMILTAYQMSRKIPKDAEVPEQSKELLKLKRKDLLVALLYYCEGYRKKEIADYLGCTEAAVRRRLSRVKRRLAVGEQEEPAEAELPEEEVTAAETAAEQVSAAEDAPEEAISEEMPQEPAPQEEPTKEETSQEATPQDVPNREEPQEEEHQEEALPEEASQEEESVRMPLCEEAAPEGETEKGGDAEC